MLKFDIIKSDLTHFLQKNRSLLHDSSLKLANEITNSCYRNMLFDELEDHRYNIFSVEIIEKYINSNIVNEKNLYFKQRKIQNGLFGDNEIHFQFYFYIKEIDYLINIPHAEYTPRKDQLTKDCVHEFFQKSENINYYTKVGKWELFNDKIVETANLSNEVEDYSVNFDLLNSYLIEMIEFLFPEYKYSEKYSTKFKRFVKNLNDNFSIAIEYDAGLIENMSKTGFIEFSQYLNIVLINKALFKKKDSPNHVFKVREDLLSLGRLGNPFIYIIMPIEAFLSNFKIVKKAEYHYEFLSKLPIETIDLGNGKTEIKYNKIYAEQAKKYLMYFLFATAYTAKDYLTYVETSVLDLINSKNEW